MKKLILVISAISCLASQVAGQAARRYNVVGPVSSMRQETAKLDEVNGVTIERPRVLVQAITYDNQGRFTQQSVYHSDGTLKWRYNWNFESIYDAAGREIERVSRDADGEITRREVSTYNDLGKLKDLRVYDGANLTFWDTFEYDAQGLKTRANYFNGDGSTREVELYHYDSQGRVSEVIHTKSTVQYRDTYKRDERGNQTEWASYDSSGKRGIKVSWRYSDDSRGNEVEFSRYDSNDNVLVNEVYTYEFDSHGNWIKSKTLRKIFNGTTPTIETEMTYRTIVYRTSQ